MRKKEQRTFTVILFVALTWAALLTSVHHADAYMRYNDGCKNCHGAFTDGTTPRGSQFKHNNKLDMHRSSYEMGTKCKLCHTNGDKRDPYLGSSDGTSENPGLGCTGCHGRQEDAGNDSLPGGLGAGLRQHHWYANRIVDTPIGPVSSRVCGDCHSDSMPSNYTPVGEHVKPVYFGTVDTNANEPCNPIGQNGMNENWGDNDFRGLDNDGDGLFDTNDPDCGGLPLCTDSDNDGYIDCDGTCAPGTLLCGDCNDSDDSLNPDAPELCDGIDNDCDGIIDNAAMCDCTPTGTPENICNNVDDDCDGLIDEDYIPVPTSCGVGECASTGEETCVNGAIVDTCVPGIPGTEGPAGNGTCNDTLDNDCDGSTDSADVQCTVVNYETYIQPVWDNNCISCHGSVNPKANLDLNPGGSCGNLHNGGYLVPGDSASSLLYQKLTTGSMQQKISPANRDMVASWIDQGAICGGPGTCTDNDFDGYGNPGDASCANGAAEDCNDSDPTIYPGAAEGPAGTVTCNDALDNDCDGYTDSADVECTFVNYETDIQPVWDTDCISCHGPGKIKADLDLTSGVSCGNLHNGGFIVPGDSASSLLYQKLTTGGMQQKTSPANKDMVASWIDQGASCAGPVTCTDNDFDGYGNPGDASCANGAEEDCNDNDPSIYPGALELCDGLDNDCDTSFDEDFPNLGMICSDGVGACEATGNYVCTADGLGTECNAAPGTPGVEGPEGDPTCSDTIDNDCDNLTDSSDSDCSSCIPTGTPENICNGVDDDCDGFIDEDYVATPTTCGAGACAGTGLLECQNAIIQDTCVVLPPAEPSDVTCDGIDGDCDGQIDEDYASMPTGCGAGECSSSGQTTCSGGAEGDTCMPGTPSAELCDGLDNDCDSSIDEDFPNLGSACTTGTGACQASGTFICAIDSLGTMCDAAPGTPGVEGPEGDPTCTDTIDNDCDGLSDGVDTDCGTYTAPPVRQGIGRPDSAFNDLVEFDCRFCHENPDQFPVDPESVPDRHHLLYNTPARVGTCSVANTIQCQDEADCPVGETCSNGSDAPFPPPFGGNYDCFTCHDADCSSGNCSIIIFRDCLVCHIQGPAEYTVHHRTDLSLGTLPQGPDCQACHGDLVNNRDDGHVISTTVPSLVTPRRSGGTGVPFNSRGNGGGACTYCHDSGTSVEGIVVETNMITHHNRGFGFDDTKCDWCHDFNLPFEEQIRVCENCHGFTSLHNIQADSDGDGVINPGIEQPFYGHIGNPDDCWGCHGFASASIAPGSDAIIPSISSTSHSVLVEGTDTTVTLYGAAFTNMNEGVELTSDVVLTAADGSIMTLTPDTITQDTITVTIPGTLSTGNYRIQVTKQNKLSNPRVISVKPAVIIADVICDRKKRLLTISGSGFSEKIEGTDEYISAAVDGQLIDIISWSNTQIRASVSRCSKRITVTVDSLFGSDTLNTKKKYGR